MRDSTTSSYHMARWFLLFRSSSGADRRWPGSVRFYLASGLRFSWDSVGQLRWGTSFWAAHLKCLRWSASATGRRLLALPFVGLLAAELVERFKTPAIVGLTVLAAFTCALAVGWSTFHPADAEDFKVDSAAAWLNRDGHDQYRYVTLGFGNKIARLAMMTDAGSVDGEWNSGRMLPELTTNGAGALTSSKYFGKSGIDALRAILEHADHYGLKWVFVRDHYYDPLLSFAGWRPVDNLEDSTIIIWSKDGIPPATPLNAPQIPPQWQGMMWGILPFGSSILALLVLLIPERKPLESRVSYSYPAGRGSCVGEVGFVSNGPLLAVSLAGATVALVAIGTLWPNASAAAYSGGGHFAGSTSTPEAAVQNLGSRDTRQGVG